MRADSMASEMMCNNITDFWKGAQGENDVICLYGNANAPLSDLEPVFKKIAFQHTESVDARPKP